MDCFQGRLGTAQERSNELECRSQENSQIEGQRQDGKSREQNKRQKLQ